MRDGEGPGAQDRFTSGERSADALEAMRFDRSSPIEGHVVAGWRHSMGRIRELASSHRAMALTVVAIGALVCALGIAVLVVRSSAPTDTRPAQPSIPAAAPVSTTVPLTPTIVVQAVGAVRVPGVYRLPVGSRVVDLLERAGGPSADFALDRVNLAAILLDGERVWVPRAGESPPEVALTAAGGGGASGTPRVDLNHATAEQLDALPGIGKTLAAAIVADRAKRGGFRTVDDLLRVKGMNRSKIDPLRDLVILG